MQLNDNIKLKKIKNMYFLLKKNWFKLMKIKK